MPRHQEVRRLPWPPKALFELVADVGSYAEFLPWVSAVRVRSNSETLMVADLIVGFGSLKETFTSRVAKERPRHIRVDYLEGPLRHLYNDWTFEPDGTGTKVHFCVDFAFRSRLFEMLAGQVFDSALRRMISAFEARARELYGEPPGEASGISSSSAHKAA